MNILDYARTGNIKNLKLEIEKGVDINIKDKYGNTALMWVSWEGYTNCIKILIDAGADINIQNKYGNTALKYAYWYGHTEIVKLLEQAGAKE